MNTANDQPRAHGSRHGALQRKPDISLFSNGNSGVLLAFEDPASIAFVRNAAEEMLSPATDFERLFAEHLVRNLWRTMRAGNLETAAIDVEVVDNQDAVERRWGKIDPESLCHLATRAPDTRAAIREYATAEASAMRRFRQCLDLFKSFRKL